MITFSCPLCRAEFVAEDYQQGQNFPCTTCGAAVQVPAAARTAPPLNAGRGIPVLNPASPSPGTDTRVRLILKGEDRGVFRTSASVKEIYQEIENVLDRIGLRVDSDWSIHGMVNHSLSFFCEIKADGAVEQQDGGREVVVDLNWTANMPVVAILIAVFVFPVGLILALVFYSQAQNDQKRAIDDKFDGLRRRLTERVI